MFNNGIDTGYKDSPTWWWDKDDPDRFRFADLDRDYPETYFPLAEPPNVDKFVSTVIEYYFEWAGKKLRTVLDFGAGGGWYLKGFQDKGLFIHGYEGSPWGVAACHRRGVMSIDLKDIRLPMERKYRMADLALWTECAEHIEMPFHGTAVSNIVSQANAVWFSTEGPTVENKPHLHHPSELPLEYWKSLFKFFKYECHELPQEINDACWGRGQCIFYNPNVYRG